MFFPLFAAGVWRVFQSSRVKWPGVLTCQRSYLAVKPATCLSAPIVSMSTGRSTAGVSIVFGSVTRCVSVDGTQGAGPMIPSFALMRTRAALPRTGVVVNGSGARCGRRMGALRLGVCTTWWQGCFLRLPTPLIRRNCGSTWNSTPPGAGVWRFRPPPAPIRHQRTFFAVTRHLLQLQNTLLLDTCSDVYPLFINHLQNVTRHLLFLPPKPRTVLFSDVFGPYAGDMPENGGKES